MTDIDEARKAAIRAKPSPEVLEGRFVTRVDASGECWLWTGGRRGTGYGAFWDGERNVRAHRWAYEHYVGPIPEGLQLDHLCRNRLCVRPEHLEPVTPQENTRRGDSAHLMRDGFCKRGHQMTPENTYARPDCGLACKTCRAAADRRRRDRERRSHAGRR